MLFMRIIQFIYKFNLFFILFILFILINLVKLISMLINLDVIEASRSMNFSVKKIFRFCVRSSARHGFDGTGNE